MDRYVIVKPLGKGSFGSASLVKRKTDGALLVIKSVDLGRLNPKEKEESRHEAKILQQLNHPNIVQFIETFERRNILYIVMEYADGGDLHQKIKNQRSTRFKEETIMHYFCQICLALEFMHHQKHILHRDIKTMNIFLTSNGTVKLGDFGISTALRNTMAMAQTVCGTPYYFSPELCRSKPYNNKSDVWAVGIVLFELMMLKYPFDGNSLQQLAQRIVKSPLPALPSCYSPELRSLVASMLDKDYHKRPSIAAVLGLPFVGVHLMKLKDDLALAKETQQRLQNVVQGPGAAPPVAPAALKGPGMVPMSEVEAAAIAAAAKDLPMLAQKEKFRAEHERIQNDIKVLQAKAHQAGLPVPAPSPVIPELHRPNAFGIPPPKPFVAGEAAAAAIAAHRREMERIMKRHDEMMAPPPPKPSVPAVPKPKLPVAAPVAPPPPPAGNPFQMPKDAKKQPGGAVVEKAAIYEQPKKPGLPAVPIKQVNHVDALRPPVVSVPPAVLAKPTAKARSDPQVLPPPVSARDAAKVKPAGPPMPHARSPPRAHHEAPPPRPSGNDDRPAVSAAYLAHLQQHGDLKKHQPVGKEVLPPPFGGAAPGVPGAPSQQEKAQNWVQKEAERKKQQLAANQREMDRREVELLDAWADDARGGGKAPTGRASVPPVGGPSPLPGMGPRAVSDAGRAPAPRKGVVDPELEAWVKREQQLAGAGEPVDVLTGSAGNRRGDVRRSDLGLVRQSIEDVEVENKRQLARPAALLAPGPQPLRSFTPPPSPSKRSFELTPTPKIQAIDALEHIHHTPPMQDQQRFARRPSAVAALVQQPAVNPTNSLFPPKAAPGRDTSAPPTMNPRSVPITPPTGLCPSSLESPSCLRELDAETVYSAVKDPRGHQLAHPHHPARYPADEEDDDGVAEEDAEEERTAMEVARSHDTEAALKARQQEYSAMMDHIQSVVMMTSQRKVLLHTKQGKSQLCESDPASVIRSDGGAEDSPTMRPSPPPVSKTSPSSSSDGPAGSGARHRSKGIAAASAARDGSDHEGGSEYDEDEFGDAQPFSPLTGGLLGDAAAELPLDQEEEADEIVDEEPPLSDSLKEPTVPARRGGDASTAASSRAHSSQPPTSRNHSGSRVQDFLSREDTGVAEDDMFHLGYLCGSHFTGDAPRRMDGRLLFPPAAGAKLPMGRRSSAAPPTATNTKEVAAKLRDHLERALGAKLFTKVYQLVCSANRSVGEGSVSDDNARAAGKEATGMDSPRSNRAVTQARAAILKCLKLAKLVEADDGSDAADGSTDCSVVSTGDADMELEEDASELLSFCCQLLYFDCTDGR